jgi:VanZ family protein
MAPNYNDDNNFYTQNRLTAALAVLVVVVIMRVVGVVAESLTRDPRPERGRPQLRPEQRHCPYLQLRNRHSHRRCHPSPNSVNFNHFIFHFFTYTSLSLSLFFFSSEKRNFSPFLIESQFVLIHIKIHI